MIGYEKNGKGLSVPVPREVINYNMGVGRYGEEVRDVCTYDPQILTIEPSQEEEL